MAMRSAISAIADVNDMNYHSPLTFGLLLTSVATATALCFLTGFSVKIPTLHLGVILFLALASERLRHGALREHLALPLIAQTLAIILAAGIANAVIVSVGQSFAMPLRDEVYLAIDRAMGFDWLSFQLLVFEHSPIKTVLGWAYMSFFQQLMLGIVMLLLLGQGRRADRMLAAFFMALLLTFAIGTVFPATGHAGVTGVQFPHLMLDGATPLADLFDLRNGRVNVIDPLEIGALISFPSLHCVGAYIATAGIWTIRPLRLPYLCLNVLMTISAVTHGAHYVCDCIAGLALAAFCFYASGYLTTWSRALFVAPDRRLVPALASAKA